VALNARDPVGAGGGEDQVVAGGEHHAVAVGPPVLGGAGLGEEVEGGAALEVFLEDRDLLGQITEFPQNGEGERLEQPQHIESDTGRYGSQVWWFLPLLIHQCGIGVTRGQPLCPVHEFTVSLFGTPVR
jgi:hypothetical protein